MFAWNKPGIAVLILQMRELGLRALSKLTELMQRILKPRFMGAKTYPFLATHPVESYRGGGQGGTLMLVGSIKGNLTQGPGAGTVGIPCHPVGAE